MTTVAELIDKAKIYRNENKTCFIPAALGCAISVFSDPPKFYSLTRNRYFDEFVQDIRNYNNDLWC